MYVDGGLIRLTANSQHITEVNAPIVVGRPVYMTYRAPFYLWAIRRGKGSRETVYGASYDCYNGRKLTKMVTMLSLWYIGFHIFFELYSNGFCSLVFACVIMPLFGYNMLFSTDYYDNFHYNFFVFYYSRLSKLAVTCWNTF